MSQNDETLRTQVEAALRGSTRVDLKEIQVAADGPDVRLRGCVDSAFEKRVARELAEDVPGVRTVIDDMQVKNFVRRPDEELVAAVRNALARDAYTEGEIEVYASNGEVRLDGTVPTYHARKAAEHVAWFVPGVANVENLLLVDEEDFVDVSPGEVVDA